MPLRGLLLVLVVVEARAGGFEGVVVGGRQTGASVESGRERTLVHAKKAKQLLLQHAHTPCLAVCDLLGEPKEVGLCGNVAEGHTAAASASHSDVGARCVQQCTQQRGEW